MLRILNFEEIQNQLLIIPSLMDSIEKKEPGFFEDIHAWLNNMEKILENNRIHYAAAVAGLRGLLDSAAQGVIPAELSSSTRGMTKRKTMEVVSAEVLRKAADLITALLQGEAERLEEADKMARKIITMANFKGMIPKKPDPRDHTGNLKAIWKTFLEDKDLQQGALQILSLVGPHDALLILDRGITRDIWSQ